MKTSSLEHKDPDVLWLHVRLLVEVELNVTIIFRFFPKMFEMTTEKVFHADDKYVLRLLNVVIHEHQFKRKIVFTTGYHFMPSFYPSLPLVVKYLA
jgi:hypothetical protein